MKKIKFYLYYLLGNILNLIDLKIKKNNISKNPKVSIIITNYNYGKFLEKAIRSSLNQTYKNKEIILVDDNSNDKLTKKKLKEIKNKYKNKIKFIFLKKNVKLPKARNLGIKESTGELICCLDADDYLDKKYLEKSIPLFKKYKNVGIVYSWTKIFGKITSNWQPLNANLLLIKKANCISVSAVFLKRIWEKIGGFNEKMTEGYEDWEFWYRSLKKGWRTKLIKEFLFYHRIHSKNMVYESDKKKKSLIKKIFYETS